jgi:hypothetical protein
MWRVGSSRARATPIRNFEEAMAMEVQILCTQAGCDNEADVLWEHRNHAPLCASCAMKQVRLRRLARWLLS